MTLNSGGQSLIIAILTSAYCMFDWASHKSMKLFLHNKCTQISFNRFDEFVCHHQLTVDLNHGYFIAKKIL